MDQARQAAKPDDPRVKAALADYMERVDRGEQVDREQFLAAHADIAAELESFIATAEQLGEMAGLKPVQATLPPPPEASTRSIAAQGEETLIPKRVAGDAKATLIQGLPERFGRYRVLKPLGSGAMGTVYLAEDTQLERKVALKTPSFEEDETGELLQRFYREAKAAATLRNPHICPVYDVGEIDGKHYISMAWIQGRPLSAYIQPDKPQAERQILIIIRKLALALDEAHRHGIIHRDLKPGNVMIDEKGEPIVMDFGLARRTQREEASRLTQSGMIVGSPAYMSPEQVEGDQEKVGPAADQYSLGVILYELLTGQLPFRGGVTAVIGAILTKEPTPVAELRKGIDPRVAALCARMMKKNAAERYPSLKAVADEVTGLLKDTGASAGKAAQETTRTPRAVESPAKPPAPQTAKVEKGAGTAAAVSITASNVTSLFEAAQKCMRKHDYEQVVQMLQQIPEAKRTDEVRSLLAKARQLADEVAFLLAEIDEAERVNDNAVLTRATDELLKLKPKHHKALQIKEELSRYGKGKLWKPGGYTPDGRRIGEGSWIPWIGIAVGVIAFALATWAVTIYLKAGDAVVRVQISDPDVKVSFQGRTLNIQSANKEFDVEPGENTLTITYNDATFETEKFTLQDGENPAVVVELLDKTLAAKFGEESIGEWPVEPQLAGATGASSTTGTNAAAAGAETVYELRTHTCRPGGFDALIARYRDYYEPLFQKLGITSVAYWTPIEEPQASNTLLVLFQHESQEAATRSWQAFRSDRLPLAVVQELYGEIGDQRVKSVFLKLTESSPIPGPVSSGKAYELRAATASAESVPAPNDSSRQERGVRLLARHGIKAYASFAATDETLSDSNRYRILEYQDEGSYKSARQAFVDDPEYKAMRAEREGAGNLAGPATSMFLRSADNLIRPNLAANSELPDGQWTWSDPVNVGPTIDMKDSAEPTATATVSADGLTIIFGRSGPGVNSDLWTARRARREAPFGTAIKLANVNSESPEGSPALSGDGLTLYFDAWQRSGGRGEWDLWYVQRTSAREEFGTPRNLGAPTNSAASEAGAKVTEDGLLLFFHSDRPGSAGPFSIWMSSRASTQEPFGEPAPLGPNVNSAGRNMDPAISADGNILIFTSDRGGGLGGSDLWMTTRASRNAAFGPAVNLGDRINTSGNEGKPALSPDNQTLYFFSRRGAEGELWYARRASASQAATPAIAANVPSGRYDVLFNKDQGWLYTYQIDADRFTRETVDILGSGKGPQPLTEGRGTIEKLAAGKFRLTYDPGTWNGKPPAEVWTAKGSDGSYTTEYWFPAENYAAQKPPNLTGVVTLRADSESSDTGWSELFNGRDLTGWTLHKSEDQQPPIPWTADSERQVLVANSGGHSWLETDKTYRDFVLSLEWRFPPGKFVGPNGSGIVVRAEGLNVINYDPKGVEIDLLRSTSADKSRGPGDFVTYDTRIMHSTGATSDRGNGMKGTITEPQVSAVTNWNTCEITCQGDRISVQMSGVLVNEATGVPQRGGKICLRSQNADVEFRSIRIRELDAGSAAATASSGGAAELVSLSELNTAEHESVPWVSANGLHIYWEGPPPAGQEGQWIWTADRTDASAKFENKRAVIAGHHPVLTSDELEVVFTRPAGMGRFEMHTASRQSTNDSFGPPQQLPHFGTADANNIPWLSADGLTLYVQSGVRGEWPQYLLARRASRTDDWGAPETFDVRWDRSQPGPAPQWLSLSDDELSLLGSREGEVGQFRVVRSTRAAISEPFSEWEYVSVPGMGQVHGRTPRYSPLTRELFLWAPPDYAQASQRGAAWQEPSDVWVIRNVDLPWSGAR